MDVLAAEQVEMGIKCSYYTLPPGHAAEKVYPYKKFKFSFCILITPQRPAAHVSMALLPQPVLASSGTQAGSLCRISRFDGVPEAA